MFHKEYADVFTGDEHWRALPVPEGDIYAWDDKSTYIKNPPYFENMPVKPAPIADLQRAARAGGAGRYDHDGPYFAGRVDSGG